MNIPNKVTVSRFILSIIYFILLYSGVNSNKIPEHIHNPLLYASLIVFIIAALTDIIDGYLARHYNIMTKFGRIADPFVDKVLICGSFIFFNGWISLKPFLGSWMVLVIIVREFLVHGLRTIAESRGISFGSTVWGKQKTLIQCLTVIWVIFYMVYLRNTDGDWWGGIILQSLIWLTLFTTIFSAVTYFYKIRQMLKQVVNE
jgi:CDP-diacylglycerol---glycerol-3-phosphate 3-phosphatidyltransferase